MGDFDRLLRALRIDALARLRQGLGDLAQLRLPLDRVAAGGGELLELLHEQHHPQQVPEDQPLLLRQVFRGDEVVEVPAEVQHLAGRPDGLRRDIDHVGVGGVEEQAQLVGEDRRAVLPVDVAVVRLLALDWLLLGRDQPPRDQLGVELFGGIRPRCQLVGDADELQQRPRQLQHGLEGLDAFLAAGGPELIDQECPVEGVDGAEHQQLRHRRRRRGQDRVVRRRGRHDDRRVDRHDRRGGIERRRRGRLQLHEAAVVQDRQHAVQLLQARLDARLIEQPLANHRADFVDLRRHLQQVRQQPPGEWAFAVEPRGGRDLELLEIGPGPILPRGVP